MGGLPDDLAFELVEPIRDLFKDEVRRLGTTLGLPFEMLSSSIPRSRFGRAYFSK